MMVSSIRASAGSEPSQGPTTTGPPAGWSGAIEPRAAVDWRSLEGADAPLIAFAVVRTVGLTGRAALTLGPAREYLGGVDVAPRHAVAGIAPIEVAGPLGDGLRVIGTRLRDADTLRRTEPAGDPEQVLGR